MAGPSGHPNKTHPAGPSGRPNPVHAVRPPPRVYRTLAPRPSAVGVSRLQGAGASRPTNCCLEWRPEAVGVPRVQVAHPSLPPLRVHLADVLRPSICTLPTPGHVTIPSRPPHHALAPKPGAVGAPTKRPHYAETPRFAPDKKIWECTWEERLYCFNSLPRRLQKG